MSYRVRPTEPDDLDEIFRIRADPMVRAQQYPHGLLETMITWRRALFEGGVVRKGPFTSGTILVDERIAGHIMRVFAWRRKRLRATYGWNLAPTYWGRGIMPAVLRNDFQTVFADPRVGEIQADCFHDNPRCLRVLAKLGFEERRINPIDRFHTMLLNRCFRWILRYRMTRERWDAQKAVAVVEASRA